VPALEALELDLAAGEEREAEGAIADQLADEPGEPRWRWNAQVKRAS
jgi:hypothetical protein